MSNILNKASLLLNPAGSSIAYKEDKIYSVLPTNGDGDFTFTGGDGGTRVNQDGYVEVTPANLASNSKDANSVFGAAQTLNATTGPFGLQDGNLVYNITSGNNGIIKAVTNSDLGSFTWSVYLKGTSTSAGQVINVRAETSGGYSLQYQQNITLTSDWVRLDIPVNFTVTHTSVVLYVTRLTGTSATEFYYYGFQLNQGSLRPYQPTINRLNYPRITYENGRGALLTEPARTNLVTNSTAGQYGNSPGSSVNTISPDGTNNATIPTPNATADRYQITIFGGSYSSGTKITYSWHYKQLGPHNGPNPNEPGGLTSLVGIVNLNRIGDPEKLYDLPDGWSRWKITYEIANGSADAIVRNYFGYVIGIGYSTSAYFGHQYEIGEFATSYIPTGTSQVTRPQDRSSKSIPSIVNTSAGTLYLDVVIKGTLSADQFYWGLYDGSGNTIYIGLYNIYGLFRIQNSYALDVNINPVFELNKRYRFALAYQTNDAIAYMNGNSAGSDNSVSIPPVTTMGINFLNENANIESYTLAYFNSRLSNTELEELTTINSGSGGNISYYGPHTIHTFTSSGTFNPSFSGEVEVLVVAGGGAGGAGGSSVSGAGGGAGGLMYKSSIPVTSGTNYAIVVGAGGAGTTPSSDAVGDQGTPSSAFGLNTTGGGGGEGNGAANNLKQRGGSGGGGRESNGTGGETIDNQQGNVGGDGSEAGNYAGGGGGAGQPGNTNGLGYGGDGLSYSISGYHTYYAGGGSSIGPPGGTESAEPGLGGGGKGRFGADGDDGVSNTGGGGGGTQASKASGNGGSGIVIIRYLS